MHVLSLNVIVGFDTISQSTSLPYISTGLVVMQFFPQPGFNKNGPNLRHLESCDQRPYTKKWNMNEPKAIYIVRTKPRLPYSKNKNLFIYV